jgi:uncharacterized protein (TIGR02246 family)
MKLMASLTVPFVLLSCLTAQTPSSAAQQDDLQQAVSNFIQAFDNLDWERFRTSFADDATVFFPRGFPERATGRTEFEKGFQQVFEQIRDGKQSPPYMHIQPLNEDIQRIGDIAIVTFHLDDRPGMLNRRTLVWQKTDHGWKIIHLHASEVKLQPN